MSETTRRTTTESEFGAKANERHRRDRRAAAKAEESRNLERRKPEQERGEGAATVIEARIPQHAKIGEGMRYYGALCLIERRCKVVKNGG